MQTDASTRATRRPSPWLISPLIAAMLAVTVSAQQTCRANGWPIIASCSRASDLSVTPGPIVGGWRTYTIRLTTQCFHYCNTGGISVVGIDLTPPAGQTPMVTPGLSIGQCRDPILNAGTWSGTVSEQAMQFPYLFRMWDGPFHFQVTALNTFCAMTAGPFLPAGQSPRSVQYGAIEPGNVGIDAVRSSVQITMQAAGAPPGAIGALMLSVGQAAIPLLGGTLLVDPATFIATAAIVADASGNAGLAMPLGAGFSAPVTMQAVFIDSANPNAVVFSNGVRTW